MLNCVHMRVFFNTESLNSLKNHYFCSELLLNHGDYLSWKTIDIELGLFAF